MKKRVLILGASYAQIDAINYCREHGHYVCGCSYTTKDSGIPLLDYFRRVDIKDVGGIAALAREQNVDVIYSVGSDLAIPTIMKVSEVMGLPHFISSETAEKCHSKHLMRTTLGDDFKGNARHIVCETLDEAMAFRDFPGMMKPVDSQGQRGCFRVDSADDIRNHFASSFEYSIIGKVIIESYVEGPEISVNAYLQDGTLKFALISDRLSFDQYPGGIIRGHRIPSTAAKGAEEEVIDLVRRCAQRLGIDNGPCYCQIKLDKERHPVILEVAPRLDGCHMWNLIRHYCGVDLIDASFRHLLYDQPVLTEPVSFPETQYELIFHCKETDAVFDRSEYDCSDAETVFWYYETGDHVRKVNGFMEKGGYIIRKIGEQQG